MLSTTAVLFNIYGINIKVMSNDSQFIQFASESLVSFEAGTKKRNDLGYKITIIFKKYHKYCLRKNSFTTKSDFYKLDKNISYDSSESRLSVKNRYFDINIKNMNGIICLEGSYFERIDQSIRVDFIMNRSIRNSNYQNIVREIVLFPVFYIIEREQQKYLLHAALIEKDGKTICLVGYNGAGKSSIAYYMSKEHGYNILSDNFVLYDELAFYPFPETIRLFREVITDKTVGRKKYITNKKINILNKVNPLSAVPDTIIFCYIGPFEKSFLKKITPMKIINMITAMHDYVKEFHNYSYTPALDFIVGNDRSEILNMSKITALEKIAKKANCYELISNNNLDLDNTAEVLLDAVYHK